MIVIKKEKRWVLDRLRADMFTNPSTCRTARPGIHKQKFIYTHWHTQNHPHTLSDVKKHIHTAACGCTPKQACTHLCTFTQSYIQAQAYIQLHVCTHKQACAHTHLCACMHAQNHTHTHPHKNMHNHMRRHTRAHTQTNVGMRARTHTQTVTDCQCCSRIPQPVSMC